jgi:hypothetical protein
MSKLFNKGENSFKSQKFPFWKNLLKDFFSFNPTVLYVHHFNLNTVNYTVGSLFINNYWSIRPLLFGNNK